MAFGACGNTTTKAPPAAVDEAAPAAARAARTDRAATFWKWFTETAETLRAESDLRKTMERITGELAKAYQGVLAEIGSDGDDRLLVLSADGIKDLFPAVQELYAARPIVKGWTIVAFRQPAKPGAPTLTIEMGDQKIEPAQLKFVATPAGAKLDLEVYIPGFTTNEEMGQIGFVILDHVLGEYDMETKVGGIRFAALAEAPAAARPLAELPALIDALK
mgnify:CR=1 FL=1